MLSDEITASSIQISKEALSVSIHCAEMTAQVMQDLILSIFRGKNESSIIHGEQSIKELNRQNKELLSVPINDKDIQKFREQLKDYGVDFSIRKDPSSDNHFVYFKGQDVAQIKDILQSTVQELLPKEQEQQQPEELQEKESLRNDKEVSGSEEKQQKNTESMKEKMDKATEKSVDLARNTDQTKQLEIGVDRDE